MSMNIVITISEIAPFLFILGGFVSGVSFLFSKNEVQLKISKTLGKSIKHKLLGRIFLHGIKYYSPLCRDQVSPDSLTDLVSIADDFIFNDKKKYMIIFGAPGCGKSFFCKTYPKYFDIAHKSKYSFTTISPNTTHVINKHTGSTSIKSIAIYDSPQLKGKQNFISALFTIFTDTRPFTKVIITCRQELHASEILESLPCNTKDYSIDNVNPQCTPPAKRDSTPIRMAHIIKHTKSSIKSMLHDSSSEAIRDTTAEEIAAFMSSNLEMIGGAPLLAYNYLKLGFLSRKHSKNSILEACIKLIITHEVIDPIVACKTLQLYSVLAKEMFSSNTHTVNYNKLTHISGQLGINPDTTPALLFFLSHKRDDYFEFKSPLLADFFHNNASSNIHAHLENNLL